jgi:hypothetical protein
MYSMKLLRPVLFSLSALSLFFCCGPADSSPLQVEQATFAAQRAPLIEATLSANLVGESVEIKFSDFPGSGGDWIAIAKPGSPSTAFDFWVYTGSATSGKKTFDNVPLGTYVARAYYDWYGTKSFEIRQESAPFIVRARNPTLNPPTLQTSRVFCYYGSVDCGLKFTEMPKRGGFFEYSNASAGTFSAEVYDTKGTVYFKEAYRSIGQWAVRAKDRNGVVLKTFDPIEVTEAAKIATVNTTYKPGAGMAVLYGQLPSTSKLHWIALAPKGSPLTTFEQWRYHAENVNFGAASFKAPMNPGTYSARVFLDNGYTLFAESDFTVAP